MDELVLRFKNFLGDVPVQEETFTEQYYSKEMKKLRDFVVQIKNLNIEPSATDMKLLEEMAMVMKSRMPKFKPKYPGFHTYWKKDLVAQEYIQYLPKVFNHEKYVAIWTNPNGRKYPLCLSPIHENSAPFTF